MSSQPRRLGRALAELEVAWGASTMHEDKCLMLEQRLVDSERRASKLEDSIIDLALAPVRLAVGGRVEALELKLKEAKRRHVNFARSAGSAAASADAELAALRASKKEAVDEAQARARRAEDQAQSKGRRCAELEDRCLKLEATTARHRAAVADDAVWTRRVRDLEARNAKLLASLDDRKQASAQALEDLRLELLVVNNDGGSSGAKRRGDDNNAPFLRAENGRLTRLLDEARRSSEEGDRLRAALADEKAARLHEVARVRSEAAEDARRLRQAALDDDARRMRQAPADDSSRRNGDVLELLEAARREAARLRVDLAEARCSSSSSSSTRSAPSSLEARCEALEARDRASSAECVALRASEAALRGEVEAAELRLRAVTSQLEATVAAYAEDDAQRASGLKRACAAEARVAALEVDKVVAEADKIRADGVRAELEEATAELADRVATIAELEKACAEYDAELRMAAKQVLVERGAAKTEREASAALRKRLDEWELESDEDRTEKLREEYDGQIAALTAEVDRLKNKNNKAVEVPEADEASARLASRVSKLDVEARELRDKVAALEKDRSDFESKWTLAEHQLQVLQKRRSSDDSDDASTSESDGSTSRRRPEKKKQQQPTVRDRLDLAATKRELERSEAAVAALEGDAERLRGLVAAAQHEADAARKEATAQQQKLTERSDRLADLREKVGAGRLASEGDAQHLAARHEAELASAQRRAETLSDELAVAKLKIAELELDKDRRGARSGAKTPAGRLASDLAAAQRKNADLAHELDQTHASLNDALSRATADDHADDLSEAKLKIAELTFELDNLRMARRLASKAAAAAPASSPSSSLQNDKQPREAASTTAPSAARRFFG